jgi:hypothetical protein
MRPAFAPVSQNSACTHAQATQSVRKNAAYFRINYLIIMLCVTFITLLVNPSSLIVLGFLTAGWSYLFVVRTSPIVIGGRTFRYVWRRASRDACTVVRSAVK